MLFRDFGVVIRSYYGHTILKGSDGMLKRKINDTLVAWKNSSKGTTTMMIDGARRVGKCFIAELFAKAESSICLCIWQNCCNTLQACGVSAGLFFVKKNPRLDRGLGKA